MNTGPSDVDKKASCPLQPYRAGKLVETLRGQVNILLFNCCCHCRCIENARCLLCYTIFKSTALIVRMKLLYTWDGVVEVQNSQRTVQSACNQSQSYGLCKFVSFSRKKTKTKKSSSPVRLALLYKKNRLHHSSPPCTLTVLTTIIIGSRVEYKPQRGSHRDTSHFIYRVVIWLDTALEPFVSVRVRQGTTGQARKQQQLAWVGGDYSRTQSHSATEHGNKDTG